MTTFATAALGTDWVEIAGGDVYSGLLVQLRGGRIAHIYVGAADPAPGENGYLTLSQAIYPGLALSPGETEKVWARAGTSLPATLECDGTAR